MSFYSFISPPTDPPIWALANFSKGNYKYTATLLALEAASPTLPNVPYDDQVSTPLCLDAWERSLCTIPDRQFAQFLLRGIRTGFRIGVAEGAVFKPSHRNLRSAYEHPQVITAYLQREVNLGRMQKIPTGSQLAPPLLQLSPFGAIPKKYKPDTWRLIVDLSSPCGYSINDAISGDLCSVSYTSVDDAVRLIRTLGRGCLLAKLDLKEAYRAVPVHPSDQRLLGVAWDDTVYIDKALPFGLRSAPKIFSALTDAMMWMLHEKGIDLALHYLDDFLVMGPPGTPLCGQSLEAVLGLCDELGFPVAPEKTEGPSTMLTFLGIEIDSVAEQVRLPQDKLARLLATIAHWMTRADSPKASGKKRELLSLIGLLSHAAIVVRPGRPFLRSLIDAAASTQGLDHWVHLNAAARADLRWWHTFLKVWNGTWTHLWYPTLNAAAINWADLRWWHTFLKVWNGTCIMPPISEPLIVVSDASRSWGCGAVHENLWFQAHGHKTSATSPSPPRSLYQSSWQWCYGALIGLARTLGACATIRQWWQQ